VVGVSDAQQPGDSIAQVFPPDKVAARFVVSMSMARNDVEGSLRDALEASRHDRPALGYKVRLSTGHLVEALDALGYYSQRHPEIGKLLQRVPDKGRQHLRVARRAINETGARVLKHVRNHTFHYPSPNPDYDPTSDEQLADVLAAMADRRALLDVDYESEPPRVTLAFAGEVAFALAMGKHSAGREELERQLTLTRDGAFGFFKWVDALVLAFFDANDIHLGDPEWREGGENPGDSL
jgi:hypothetical protein